MLASLILNGMLVLPKEYRMSTFDVCFFGTRLNFFHTNFFSIGFFSCLVEIIWGEHLLKNSIFYLFTH